MWFRKNKKYLILMLVVAISIGFAYLSVNMIIQGNFKVKGFVWDVSFGNYTVSQGSVDDYTIQKTGDTSFEISAHLSNPGDYLEFTIPAENAGTVNAIISDIELTGLTTESSKYLSYSVNYSDGTEVAVNDILEADTSENYVVKILYRTDVGGDYLPTENVTGLNFGLSINFQQTKLSNQ